VALSICPIYYDVTGGPNTSCCFSLLNMSTGNCMESFARVCIYVWFF